MLGPAFSPLCLYRARGGPLVRGTGRQVCETDTPAQAAEAPENREGGCCRGRRTALERADGGPSRRRHQGQDSERGQDCEKPGPRHHTHLSPSAGARSFSGPVPEANPEAWPSLCPCWRAIRFILPTGHISVHPPTGNSGGGRSQAG